MFKVIKKFLDIDRKDKIVFFLTCSMIGNILMAVLKFVMAVSIPSFWFFINSGFSLVLGMSKILTIKCYKKVKNIKDKNERIKEEYKNYTINGVMLMLLGIVYFFVSSYMYYNGTNTTMHEYVTYLVALIAFTSIGNAIYGMIKYKRNYEPIIKGIKITNFANALTSIVLTQVVLLDTYAKGYDSTLNGYTGMGVSIIIIILGLSMVSTCKKDNIV